LTLGEGRKLAVSRDGENLYLDLHLLKSSADPRASLEVRFIPDLARQPWGETLQPLLRLQAGDGSAELTGLAAGQAPPPLKGVRSERPEDLFIHLALPLKTLGLKTGQALGLRAELQETDGTAWRLEGPGGVRAISIW
ncbi:MAG TPA: hypothetical protein PKM61_07805, partial [bacterium]|nr:hypothetical protein [bacterium]